MWVHSLGIYYNTKHVIHCNSSNSLSCCDSAYPCTGAFSRTAVMSRSGAKTPMAGVFSGAVVVMALYVLTPAFFYIPEAVLGAVVIHAVVDLVSGPSFLRELWKSSILEFMIFVIAVIISIFMDVETAIYISVGLSLLLMLLRLARPSISILGRAKLAPTKQAPASSSSSTSSTALDVVYGTDNARYIYVDETDVHFHHLLDPLPEGILVIRLSSAILYPNANYIAERIIDIVQSRTRPFTNPHTTVDVVWNQPSTKEIQQLHHHVPHLQALVLDFSGVDQLDATAVHTLHATREALNRYVGTSVDWHFCHLVYPQVRQALLGAGFGSIVNTGSSSAQSAFGISIHNQNKDVSYSAASMPTTFNSLRDPMDGAMIMESNAYHHQYYGNTTSPLQPLEYSNALLLLPEDKYPAFHWDVESAIYTISQQNSSSGNKKDNTSSITATVY